jgi:hypothetical protein
VTLARLYINRGTWAKGLLAIMVAVAVIWGGYALLISGPRQRHLVAIPHELTAQGQAIVHEAKVPEVKARAEQLASQGQTALSEGNTTAAERVLGDLKALRAQLEQEYEVRIVSRRHERSGVWRVSTLNPQSRNYYIIVEAVQADGTVLTLPVTNEEDGKTSSVSAWGLRVNAQLFKQIAADKQDDGIIQNRRFGIKRRGYLEPEYLMPTTGAAITSW